MPTLTDVQALALPVLDWLLDPRGQRRTGRTTLLALGIVRAAMRHPGVSVSFIDHTSPRRDHLRLVRDIIDDWLENSGLVYRLAQDSLRFGDRTPPNPNWLPPGWQGGSLVLEEVEATLPQPDPEEPPVTRLQALLSADF